ncbi:MAG: squalene/phytoene synthase family protein [Salinarimonadaceae bacterium]|nr:MAG: squalene/phytoene synthase family protein [Salinarimonadaceae bacterium]
MSEAAFAHCEALVREGDPDRYFPTLFAPADKRPYLHALYAFSLEVSRIREAVTQSLAGEIRLQWWRDALSGEARGDASANPVAAALEETIARFSLPRAALLALIDARTHDLYDDPIATLNDLEGYCGETYSAIFRLASLVLADGRDPGAADAAGHGGVAWAMTGLMRAFPWTARRGQLYLPPLDILAEHGLARNDVVSGRGGEALKAALRQMRDGAREHLALAQAALADADPRIGPAFLPLALVPLYLDAMERSGYAPFDDVVEVPLWRRLWRLWRASRAGFRGAG